MAKHEFTHIKVSEIMAGDSKRMGRYVKAVKKWLKEGDELERPFMLAVTDMSENEPEGSIEAELQEAVSGES